MSSASSFWASDASADDKDSIVVVKGRSQFLRLLLKLIGLDAFYVPNPRTFLSKRTIFLTRIDMGCVPNVVKCLQKHAKMSLVGKHLSSVGLRLKKKILWLWETDARIYYADPEWEEGDPIWELPARLLLSLNAKWLELRGVTSCKRVQELEIDALPALFKNNADMRIHIIGTTLDAKKVAWDEFFVGREVEIKEDSIILVSHVSMKDLHYKVAWGSLPNATTLFEAKDEETAEVMCFNDVFKEFDMAWTTDIVKKEIDHRESMSPAAMPKTHPVNPTGIGGRPFFRNKVPKGVSQVPDLAGVVLPRLKEDRQEEETKEEETKEEETKEEDGTLQGVGPENRTPDNLQRCRTCLGRFWGLLWSY